jgi:hypothetical protein
MTLTVTLLISSGDPDPTWTLTPEQEQAFMDKLADSPLPSTSVGSPSRRPGYAGIMVRDGGGERWVVYRGWIRGGTLSRVDDKRVLERWLLDSGQAAIAPKVFADLTKQLTPSF